MTAAIAYFAIGWLFAAAVAMWPKRATVSDPMELRPGRITLLEPGITLQRWGDEVGEW